MGLFGSKSQVVGYAYFAGLAVSLCSKVDSIMCFKMGDKVQYKGSSPTFEAMTGELGKTYSSKTGKTTVRFYNGSQTFTDEYLLSKTGADISYSNTAYFALRQGFIGDNVAAVPNYGCVVRRTELNGGWVRQRIGNDVNPAAALYYILKTLIGYPDALLDEASFKAANDTLYNEGFGISFTMTQASEAKTYIDEILKTIDAVLQIDPFNGKMKLKLLRGDYTLSQLPSVNETNSAKVTFSRRGNEELYSRVTITYKENRANEQFIENSVSAVNTAARLLIGYEKTFNANYKMLSAAASANKALDREFKRNSYPIASVKFTCSAKDFGHIAIGDVINFSNAALGVLNMPVRVTSIGGDKERAQEIEISGGEDIFAIGSITIAQEQENESETIIYELPDIQYTDVKDAPAEHATSQRDVNCLAVYPQGFTQFLTATDGLSGQSVNLTPCYLGTLAAPYGVTEDMDEGDGFAVTPLTDMWSVSLTDAGFQRLKGVAYIEDELIAYQFRTAQGDGNYAVSHIMRGLFNTEKKAHPKGARVWFIDIDGNDFMPLPIQSTNPSIIFKAGNFRYTTPNFTINHNYKFSVETPYPPANAQGRREGGEIIISWYPCVRLHGAGPRNADNLIAGQDEGVFEGEWLIEWSGGSQIIGSGAKVGNGFEFRRSDAAAKTYTIRSRLNGYLSKPKTVVI